MPDPVDNFADGDTDLATGVVQTATEQAMGTEIMPGGDDGAPNENNTAPYTGSNDDFSVGAAQQQQPEQTDDYSGLTDLQQEAQQVYGFSEDELNNIDDERLGSMLGAMDRRFTNQYSDAQQQHWQAAQQQAQMEAQQQQAEGMEPDPFDPNAEGGAETYQGFQPEMLEQAFGEDHDFEPEVVEAFNKISEHYNTQFASAADSITQLEGVVGQLVNELGGVTQDKQIQQQQQYDAAMDGFFHNLEGPLKESYGSGRAAEMDPQSPELAKRMEFANEVGMFVQYALHSGQTPDLQQIQQRVLRSRHSNEMDANARHQVRQQAQQRRQQAMRRPNSPATGRGGTPEDNAASFANSWYREHGMEPTSMTSRSYGDL